MTSPEQSFSESNLLNQGLLGENLFSSVGEGEITLGIEATPEAGLFTDPFNPESENLSLVEQLIAQEQAKTEEDNNSVFSQIFPLTPSVPANDSFSVSGDGIKENDSFTGENIIETLFPLPDPILGDADGDCDLDFDDVDIIYAERNTPAVGDNDVRDLDGDGTITVLDSRKLVAILRGNTDFTSPNLNTGLSNDTGILSNDGITTDPSISGMVLDVSPVTSLKAGFAGTAEKDFIKIVSVINDDGSFTLNQTQLEAINGSPLTDGEYTLSFRAKDKWANETELQTVSFTLDTTAPDLSVELSPDSDTGEKGDNITTEPIVDLTGQTEPGSTVTVDGTTIEAIADEDGNFTFFDISLDEEGENEFTFTATDKAGNQTTTSLTIELVSPVGEPPVLTVPDAQTVAEDEALAITGITVVDSDSGELEVTLAVNNGQIDLTFTTGLTFSIGDGVADSNLTFTGSIIDINNALATITYQGDADFNGDDALAISVSDGELEDTASIPLTITPVNDAPVLTIPDALTTDEDTSLNITGISVDDIDVGDGDLEITLTVNNGVISLPEITGLDFSDGDGVEDSSVTFTGTLEDINNALASIVYQGNLDFNGNDELSVTVSDLGNTGAGGELIADGSIDITVTPVDGGIVLLEGNNFRVEATETITIPNEPSVLRFTYSDLVFDTEDTDFINDGFEVALVDSEGNSLIQTIANSRDAFFNLTEGEDASLANGVSIDGETVTVNLAGISPGTEANLIFRLVNNDDDTTTTVRITDFEVETAAVTPPGGVTPNIAAINIAEDIDFASLDDISASFVAQYERTSFNEETDTLYVDVAINNQAQYLVDAPLLVVVENISDATVTVLDADGFTPEGLPYFDFSSLIDDGTLDPDEVTDSRTISFLNPNGVQFDYDLTFLGNLNQAPEFTSEPDLEAIVGKPYIYDADAIDADSDTLTYSLSVAPQGMTIDSETGEINWSPEVGEEGTYNVIVVVEDGRGGVAEQNYTISAIAPPPNRPPVITSAPVISGNVGTDYSYPVIATDPDGDILTYAVTQAPSGLAIDEDTGEITWNPDSEQVGVNDVVVEVTDENGATATQSYQIIVAQALGNNDPVIVSDPIVQVNIDRSELGNPEPIDLSTWSPIFYSGTQVRARWEIQPDTNNNVVLQTINASPSIFIGDFELVGNKVEGTWKVDTSFDDDLIGFAFGYQDPQNFYLFDWKQGTQFDPPQGLAEQGMNVKVVTTDTIPTGPDLFPSEGVEGRVKSLFSNSIAWEDFVEYGFSLEFLPGQFTITVTNAETDTVLESIVIEDDTFTDGRFGFYNNSQNEVLYSGFTLQNLPTGNYRYDVDAIDPDADPINYELVDAPFGMRIDADTGEVLWNPTENDLGTYDVIVAAKDDKGGVDTQTYQLEVTDREVGAIEGTIFSQFTDNPDPVAQANVDVYLDTNNNGVLDPNEPTQKTVVDDPNTLNIDETGQYSFDNLVNGTYTVRQIVPSGFEQIIPGSDAAYTVIIDAEQTISDRDFTNSQTGELVNIAPTITSEAITETEAGREYRYQVTATDPNPDLLTFDLPVKPEGMEINPDTGLIIWNPQQGRSGEVSVVARVRDGEGGVDLQTFNLNLVPPNFDPVITSTPPNAAGVEVPLAYQVIALDDVSDTLTYALDNAPAGATIDPDTGLLSWTPTSGQVGNSDFTVLVTDDRDGSTTQTFTIETVADFPNNDPVITSTPRTVVRVEDTYQYQIAANDPDSEPLSYSLDSPPAGMTVSDTGLIEWVTTPEQFGDNTVTLTVSDTRGGTAQQSFNIEVVSEIVNRTPVFESEPPRVVIAGETLIYNPVVTDSDGDRLIFYAEPIFDPSDPFGLEEDIPNISEETPGFTINPNTGEIRWNPNFEDLGTVQIALSAADPYGAVTTQVFDLEVTAGNRPPLITSVPVTQTAVGDNYAYGIAAEDPDGNAVTLNLEQAPVGMTLDGNTIIWQPEASQLGDAEVIISATDEFGAVTTQEFTVVVAATLPNRPPTITSTPDRVATPNVLYEYAVTATDPEGETLTYTVENAPDGLIINEDTGLIQWTPTTEQVGATEIIVNAIDPEGARSRQTFSLVVDVNDAPVIDSTPVTTIDAGLTYQYDLQASDPDGERLTYTLVEAPEGMTIDSLGRIIWETDSSDVGTFEVEVAVSDPRGATVNQTYQLEVTADTEAPTIDLLQNNTVVDIGSSVIFQVNARDNVGVETLTLTVDGVPVALDARGQASVTVDSFGEINAVATATDAAGNISTDTAIVQGVDPNDVNAPILDITSIANGDILTAPTDIIGTVNDDNLVSYSLAVAPLAGGEFIEIASGTNPVVDGELANFDTSLLQNDTYRLRLTATDAGGNTSTIEREVSIEGELKLGNFQLSFVDLTIPVTGIPITVARTYDTLDVNEQDDFGFGWSLGIVDTNLRTSVPPSGLEAGDIYNPFSIGDRVYVTNPSTGRREGFTFSFVPPSRFNVFGTVRPRFIPDAGVTSTLSVSPADLVIAENGELFDFTTGIPYNPASSLFGSGDYTLTTKEGIAFRIDGNTGDVETVTDRNNNVLTFTDAGILSSTGEEITFERDAQNRITAVIDPAGERIEYGYDANGDLVSVTDREGNTTQFEYSEEREHYLDEVIDPLGREAVRNEYDENGRLTKVFDVKGNPLEFAYDPDSAIEIVIDQLGNSTQFIYDDFGNITTGIDALNNVTQFTYDEDNNLISEIDPLGNTTTFTYDDRGNILQEIDAEGNEISFTYDQNNNLLTSTDALGRTTTNIYDDRGNLASISGLLNGDNDLEYSSQGNLLSLTEGEGNRIYEYNQFGRLISEISSRGNEARYTYDANGNRISSSKTVETSEGSTTIVTTREYDAENRIIRVTDENGNSYQNIYDEVGNLVEVIDPLGRSTKFIFDERNLLLETIFPDSTTENDEDNPRISLEYDVKGQLIAETDELGRTTRFVYDAVGQLVETILPDETPENLDDNPRIKVEYDSKGRVIAEIDERGNRTQFVYDKLDQLVETILPDTTPEDETDNPKIISVYNAAGVQTKQIDALGNVTEFFYDDLGRPISQKYANGEIENFAYNNNGQLISQSNSSADVTSFENDSLGRLTTIVDSLNQRTEYSYDERGNLATQKDANGNITEFEYDNLGRPTLTRLPEGDISSLEYNELGLVIRKTDANGAVTNYSYDERDRLVAENFADGTSVSYKYTLTSQIETVEDENGLTSYSYDAQDRLIRRIDPDGSQITYTYDVAGNRTSVESLSGRTTYTYDELNRIQTVTDPEGRTTTYEYDANSNLIRTEFPNGTNESREYDSLNRLIYLETKNTDNEVLQSFRYELDNEGYRTQVTEHTGRIVKYFYDELNRLEKEEIFDSGSNNATRIIEYTYDAVGNRLSRVDSENGTTLYTYNNNDRLITETHEGKITTYTYDANGNTISKATESQTIIYDWDTQDRLKAVDLDEDGTNDITYEYNSDDIRIAKIANGEEVRFLVDSNRTYAQVLEEYNEEGIIQTSYVYGNDLISQERLNEVSFFHTDAIGSTRALSDETGDISDIYIYDAFGRVLTRVGDNTNSYLFAGEQRDSELDLDYLRARYLSYETGRFISKDVFPPILSSPITLHRYIYANASPVNFTDPTGLFSLAEINFVQAQQNYLKVKRAIQANQIIDNTSFLIQSIGLLTFVTVGGVLATNLVGTSSFAIEVKNPIKKVPFWKKAGIRYEFDNKTSAIKLTADFNESRGNEDARLRLIYDYNNRDFAAEGGFNKVLFKLGITGFPGGKEENISLVKVETKFRAGVGGNLDNVGGSLYGKVSLQAGVASIFRWAFDLAELSFDGSRIERKTVWRTLFARSESEE